MRWYAVLAVFVIALLGTAAPAAAQRVRPLDQILPQIRASHPGTFYDAEGPFRGPDGRMHYRLKWMTPSGRIIWLDTDAATGRVLGQSGGPRTPSRERSRRRYAPHGNDRDDRDNWQDGRSRDFPRRHSYGRQGLPSRVLHDLGGGGRRGGDRDDDGRRGGWPYR